MGLSTMLSRRRMMQWGLASAGAPLLARALSATAFAQNLGPGNLGIGDTQGRDNAKLFPGDHTPGGGQLEIRMNQSIHTSDPDELEVAHRLRPFNPESWYQEWRRVAEKNEALAEQYEAQGLKVSAQSFYLRAFDFHRLAIVYQQETDATMMPGYMKMREMFDKAYAMGNPPFERVTINVDGHQLNGFFRKPGGPVGTRFPTVIHYQGADSLAENTIQGTGSWSARGMASMVVDLPGQGAAKRIQKLFMPPDTERLVSDLIDYLETRPDVDPDRIAIRGVSMGGYAAPRAASGDSRIKAVAVSSGSLDLLRDIFDYYPPIQDRLRWIIGASDLTEARRRYADYTMEGVAQRIECPMLLGYGPTDRIMNPEGALRLQRAATNADITMWSQGGHSHHDEKSGGPEEIGFPTMQDWMSIRLGTQPAQSSRL